MLNKILRLGLNSLCDKCKKRVRNGVRTRRVFVDVVHDRAALRGQVVVAEVGSFDTTPLFNGGMDDARSLVYSEVYRPVHPIKDGGTAARSVPKAIVVDKQNPRPH